MDKQKEINSILQDLMEKLEFAKEALREMDESTQDIKLFRRRLSSFLNESGSITTIVEGRGKNFAKHLSTHAGSSFIIWFNQKRLLFGTPTEQYPDQKGTDDNWTFLLQARHNNIHLEPAKTNSLSITIPIQVGGPKVINLNQTENETILYTLYVFNEIKKEIVGSRDRRLRTHIFKPAKDDDIVTICTDHIKKLNQFIEELERLFVTLI
jgi:hypothetical protein